MCDVAFDIRSGAFESRRAEKDQPSHPSLHARFDIGNRVPNEDARPQIQIEILAGTEKQTWSRFSIGRVNFVFANAVDRVIWAVVDPCNLNLLFGKLAVHPICERQELLLSIITPGNASLIRDNDKEVIEGLRGSAEIEDPLLEYEIRLRMDIALFEVNDAVSIKEKRFLPTHVQRLRGRISQFPAIMQLLRASANCYWRWEESAANTTGVSAPFAKARS